MITTDIKAQVKYLGEENFVKFTNTKDFPGLSAETADFLKNIGVYSERYGLPSINTNGVLKQFKSNLIEFGTSRIDHKYCIDIATQNIIHYDIDDNSQVILNSSLKTLLMVQYIIIYYYREIEGKKYGPFYQNNNHKKYAKEFRRLLNMAEPTGIEKFIPWEQEIFQKELGVV
jgi:hypothetical protein